jgi:predicted ATPase
MALKQIEAHNFKSFRDLSVELGQLNVLIGANASGKSNFVQLLGFVRDTANYGLRNALSIQGGREYFLNLVLGLSQPFQIQLQLAESALIPGIGTIDMYRNVHLVPSTSEYSFSLLGLPDQNDLIIASDQLLLKGDFVEADRSDRLPNRSIGIGAVGLRNQEGKIILSIQPPSGMTVHRSPMASIMEEVPTIDGLLLTNLLGLPFLPPRSLADVMPHIAIYDLNAKLPKQAAQASGKIDLEEDGSNLVIALKNILEDEDKRRLFSNLLQDILPFISDIDVQRFADRFLHFRLRETYSGGQYLPASLMSDGTVNITALIVALYFSDKPLIVIEEPEKNIHPYLIARVANMLKDASRHKQIIVTTHNPEIVRNVDLNDLLLVSRDRDGFSTIRRPAEDKEVRTFLSNEIGIDELFARNMLGV